MASGLFIVKGQIQELAAEIVDHVFEFAIISDDPEKQDAARVATLAVRNIMKKEVEKVIRVRVDGGGW